MEVELATLFFSYSHVDEDLRDQMETHLSGLRRQGLIESWHDRRIMAGEEFGNTIDSHIDTANIILLLVSPDFIASDYCYEREMMLALERHERGGMNEAVMVRSDEQLIYFEALGMQSYGNSKEKLTFQGAAELFWDLFIRPLQA